MNDIIAELIFLAPPLLLALTLHEFAHGYVAYRLGDPTAKSMGRLTLNPLKHLDPVGTLAFFLIKIGWAKPVPVNPVFFKNPKKDMLWVALAGPATNLALAIACALLAKGILLFCLLLPSHGFVQKILLIISSMLVASVWINLVFCIFNFLPIPPLDGSRILTGLLPNKLALGFLKIERYGFIFLLIMVVFFSDTLSGAIMPVIKFANNLLLS